MKYYELKHEDLFLVSDDVTGIVFVLSRSLFDEIADEIEMSEWRLHNIFSIAVIGELYTEAASLAFEKNLRLYIMEDMQYSRYGCHHVYSEDEFNRLIKGVANKAIKGVYKDRYSMGLLKEVLSLGRKSSGKRSPEIVSHLKNMSEAAGTVYNSNCSYKGVKASVEYMEKELDKIRRGGIG